MHYISVESTNVMSPDNASEQEKSPPISVNQKMKSFGTIM